MRTALRARQAVRNRRWRSRRDFLRQERSRVNGWMRLLAQEERAEEDLAWTSSFLRLLAGSGSGHAILFHQRAPVRIHIQTVAVLSGGSAQRWTSCRLAECLVLNYRLPTRRSKGFPRTQTPFRAWGAKDGKTRFVSCYNPKWNSKRRHEAASFHS